METILEANHLRKTFKKHGVKAVDDVTLAIPKGRTLGLVGESGCGKSTLAKLLLGLLPADGGEVFFGGQKIAALKGAGLKNFRKNAQIIFQHPHASLDPRLRVREILAEPFWIHGRPDASFLKQKVAELLERVGLPPHFSERLPRELSGGECQRVAIARAVSLDPALVICDEPVSSLDALVQAGILNLLLRLQREKGIACLFISHDLRVVRHMSDEILRMKCGKIGRF
ncbi:MAG: ABC transporter ATP-binding protein [Candidatus Omnitrophica bacterium]|nr:ABC transporter ATP-binding protein [Candidatus Omnitrophota bacterium]